MLRGDVTRLSEILGVSRGTVYARAKKAEINLAAVAAGRCHHTIDVISNRTLTEDRDEWIKEVAGKLVKKTKAKKIETPEK